MKNLILLLSLCLFSSVSWSGCVQGNCANGQGTFYEASGWSEACGTSYLPYLILERKKHQENGPGL